MIYYTTLSVFTAPNVTLNSADTSLEAIDSVIIIPPEVVRRRELASDLHCVDTLYYLLRFLFLSYSGDGISGKRISSFQRAATPNLEYS